MGVILKHPLILRIASFCAVCSMVSTFFFVLAENQTGDAYVSTGRMIAWKTFRQLAKCKPWIELPRTARARTVDRVQLEMIVA